MKSFNDRAEKEVEWRRKNMFMIRIVAWRTGLPPLVVGSQLSKLILGGRKPIFSNEGEHIGYA
jgi:hypothetical protein